MLVFRFILYFIKVVFTFKLLELGGIILQLSKPILTQEQKGRILEMFQVTPTIVQSTPRGTRTPI